MVIKNRNITAMITERIGGGVGNFSISIDYPLYLLFS